MEHFSATREPTTEACVKKVIFGSSVTCAVFFLLEGLLAVVGVRATVETHDLFVGFASSLPLYVEKVDTDGQVVMATAQNKLAYFNDQSFLRNKPAGTYRIFCLGGSTTYGRPYNDATSFPGWLRQLLPIVDTESNWEVINAGGIVFRPGRTAGRRRAAVLGHTSILRVGVSFPAHATG